MIFCIFKQLYIYLSQHCEKQIAELQSKLLETQQQLAVAISTDKKKDAMIEQLDKVGRFAKHRKR